MRLRTPSFVLLLLLALLGTIYAFQQRRQSPFARDDEDNPIAVPADWDEKTEFVFARLRYRNLVTGDPRATRMWAMRGRWQVDYPKADRQFVQGVRRLSRIHTRSVEEVVGMDSDEIFNWPWLYAVEVGHWDLSDTEAKRLREYFDRGGFLMTDDFHGTFEWEVFMRGINHVFPEKTVVDLPDSDPIFHVLYDLDERFQVPGIQYWYTGRIYEYDGFEAKWRGVYDDKGRVQVAISHNIDLGDAWEWADHPSYPERYASLAYRLGINYIIYAMTH